MAARGHKVFHYDSYTRGGPAITEQVALRKLLTEIKALRAGMKKTAPTRWTGFAC